MYDKGMLLLSDGTVFQGNRLLDKEMVTGEIVFSTSMTGYVETLTDPSFFGQIVVLSNPEIGNYGVSREDFQSKKIQAKALVVRNPSFIASSYRSQLTIIDWLARENVQLLWGVDTRTLISHIRNSGVMVAGISSFSKNFIVNGLKDLKEKEVDLDKKLSHFVSVDDVYEYDSNHSGNDHHAVVMDFGVKKSILQQLSKQNIKLTIVPGDTSSEEILKLKPDGLFLSNGPGDPKKEDIAVSTVKELLGKLPIFGICLGHQILSQAVGLSTYKLKFGHRGANQAVRRADGSIITTAQNHGYAVKIPQFTEERLISDINVSDGTNEGLQFFDKWAFSVQFHPEGAPGPLDGLNYFNKFASLMSEWKECRQDKAYHEQQENLVYVT